MELVGIELAEWLQHLAACGAAGNPLDLEIAPQLSLAIENWSLVDLALNRFR